MPVATYNLGLDYGREDASFLDVSHSPRWILAVVRLDVPLSYSRQQAGSVNLDVSVGAKTRGETLVIAEDCVHLQVQRGKANHTKSLQASIKPGAANYLVEVLPGDWVLAWIVHDADRAEDLKSRIARGEACNGLKDGLKFVGRVDAVRKRGSRDPRSGRRVVSYALTANAFKELDTEVFYDQNLSDGTVEAQNIGRWLAKLGVSIQDIFAITGADEQADNVHLLIPTFVDLLVGRGVSDRINPVGGGDPLRAFTGGGPAGAPKDTPGEGETKEAPFAYLVPKEVGQLLGRSSRDASKEGGILAYADLLTLLVGVQKYSSGRANTTSSFVPDVAVNDPLTTARNRYTGTPLLGSFLPVMADFVNKPLWSVLQQYLNPVVNEMYTALRVQEDGSVGPTLVLRQIPFTTTPMAQKLDGATESVGVGAAAGSPTRPAYTAFMSLPRWVLPAGLVQDFDVGRSDAARINFVHVYGQNADLSTVQTVTAQLVQNLPIRDDLDIQRSGLHAYMSSVACREINAVGTTPSVWMELAADWLIGGQYVLNGQIECLGIALPVAEGDNVEFDGVVYHIESITDSCSAGADGSRTWRTVLGVSNGYNAADSDTDTDPKFPIYPGFNGGNQGGGTPAPNALEGLDPGTGADTRNGPATVAETPVGD